jgi:hypothetical protein
MKHIPYITYADDDGDSSRQEHFMLPPFYFDYTGFFVCGFHFKYFQQD